MTLEARIEKLERQNRIWKAVGITCLAVLGGVFFLGAAFPDAPKDQFPLLNITDKDYKHTFVRLGQAGIEFFDADDKKVLAITSQGIEFFGKQKDPVALLHNDRLKIQGADITSTYLAHTGANCRFSKASGSLIKLGGNSTNDDLEGATVLWNATAGSMLLCSKESLRIVNDTNGKSLATVTPTPDLTVGNPDPEAPGIDSRTRKNEADIAKIKAFVKFRP